VVNNKAWKKKPKRTARAPEAKGLDHRKLPVGQVQTSPVRGSFLALPLFGWVAQRDKVGTPLVMLGCLLLRSATDAQPRGVFQIELPVLEETELATVAALERFGWDGRVYPNDDGWPDGTDDQEQVEALMAQANLRATLTFPSGDDGAQDQEIKIERSQGPFLMPPLPKPEEDPNPQLVERLKQLCADPQIFPIIVRDEA
jgi:hypothetical protein